MPTLPKPANYTIHTAVFSSGERFPVLLHKATGQPVSLPTRYVVDERRDQKQASTIDKDVRVIGWLYQWAANNGEDLEVRLRVGPDIFPTEITSFARYLRSLRQDKIVGVIVPTDGDYDQTGERVILSPQTFNDYMGIVKAFLLWSIETRRDRDKNISAGEIDDAKRRIERAFNAQFVAAGSPPRLYGLSDANCSILTEAVRPEALNNPFNKPTRLRNYTIICLLIETGIRRSELCKLRVEDLVLGGASPFIKVVRRPDDPLDPRRREPRVKTRGRSIPISKNMARLLVAYLRERGKQPDPFVFVSTRGGTPLIREGINEICYQICRRFPELREAELTPHSLRRTFNDRLLEAARAEGWKQQQIDDLQRYLNGWTEGSMQGFAYNAQFIEGHAMEIAAVMQRGLYTRPLI